MQNRFSTRNSYQRFLASVVAVWAIASTADSREIYVSNTLGQDRASGVRPYPNSDGDGPVKTIARALRLARRGDEIIIQDTGVPYRECITLTGPRHSGRTRQRFAIYGNGATLDGSVPVEDSQWEHFDERTFRYQPRRQTHLQVFYENKPLVERSVPPGAATPPELEPLEWCMFGGNVYFCCEDDKLPYDYALTQTGHPVGVTLYRVQNVVIDGLTIQGFQLDGVNAHDLVEQTKLVGVVCRGNGRSGIAVGGTSALQIERGLVGNNRSAEILVERYADLNVVQSVVIDEGAPAFAGEGRIFIEGRLREEP